MSGEIVRRVSIEVNGERLYAVLEHQEVRPGAMRYVWKEEATGGDCEMSATTIRQAEDNARSAWRGRKLRWHEGRQAAKAGTPPNTHLILTAAELAYCAAHGGKSATIHEALRLVMKA